MIIVATPNAHHIVRDRLDQMFHLRHDVCIEQWGWKVPNQKPGIDQDDFDTDQTIYLMYIDQTRDDVIGCCRLNPTTGPYMVSELWTEQCDLKPPPNDPKIWESSRFCISRRLSSKEEYMEIMWRMCAGVCEYCVASGIDAITWYTAPAFYQTINSLMPVEPLGQPYRDLDDDATYLPGVGYISQSAVDAARANMADPSIPLTYIISPLGQSLGIGTEPTKRAA